MSTLGGEIATRLGDYLMNVSSLEDFDTWFTEATWHDREYDEVLNAFIGRIELLLAEYSSGDWTESEFKEQLQGAIDDYYEKERQDGPKG